MTEVTDDSQASILQKLNQLLNNQVDSAKLTETISQKVETNAVDLKAMKDVVAVDLKAMKDVVEKLAKEVSKQNKSFSDTREIIFRYEKKQGG